MLGGAVSMGLAAFISARSQIEFYQSEIERENLEMRKWPDRERDEIRAIYRSKGFAGKLLDEIVEHITSDPQRWSDVMMREELGLSGDFESPLRSGSPSGLPTWRARRSRFLPTCLSSRRGRGPFRDGDLLACSWWVPPRR